MMNQYLRIKSKYKDALLFYRMGDFYELFFEDAEIASAALNITLTKRGKHKNLDIPMCGVPYHSSENYLNNLIRQGHRVAVCEQLEKPEEAKKRGYKAVVNRDVVRLITPGTLTEDMLLHQKKNNFLMCLNSIENLFGAAWIDISTGEFNVTSFKADGLNSFLIRVSPSEVIMSSKDKELINSKEYDDIFTTTTLSDQTFNPGYSKKKLEFFFNTRSLEVFGTFNNSELTAMGALVSYIESTQCGNQPVIEKPKKENTDFILRIDGASRKNLELTQTLAGESKGSLLSIINRTVTNGGARLLESRLRCPSLDIGEINSRLCVIDYFLQNTDKSFDSIDVLKVLPDIQRSVARLSLRRGSSKDLLNVRNTLNSMNSLTEIFSGDNEPDSVTEILDKFKGFDDLFNLLDRALIIKKSEDIGKDYVIKNGFDPQLDNLRKLKSESQSVLILLQKKYSDLTGVSSLKIKFNNVLGYFIETPIAHKKTMQDDRFSEILIHRQTTVNCIRFTTPELSTHAEQLLNAQETAADLELEIIETIRKNIVGESTKLNNAATGLSELDLYTSLALLSKTLGWVRPLVDDSRTFNIKQGRHPVVEAFLTSSSEQFVANDCDLTPKNQSILLLTGPNMAGKSTFLRQNALITILAQMGSYVPAEKAHIGVVNQIFSRVGASDNLAKGQSTFMVEMLETATILNQADEATLIIMDEIGRGTSTYDGLSIAWACLEHIHNKIKCRTLFATHYHELTQISNYLANVKNAKVAIKEWKDEVIFLHQVQYGKADKSYGIQVAKLAGLPKPVLDRSLEILKKLEKDASFLEASSQISQQLSDTRPTKVNDKNETDSSESTRKALECFEQLSQISTDDITPKDALLLLDELVKKTKEVF